MDNKFILTDGLKAVNLLDSDDPNVWTFFSNAPHSNQDELYARVSAAFRAYSLKANTVGNMPFSINDLDTGEVVDESATWENKVGFLPNPSELLRLDTLSYIATNKVYNLMTADALGYKPRGLYNAVSYNFTPFVNPATNQLDYIERKAGTGIERYAPDGKPILNAPRTSRLIYMWRLDHTTEVLASQATEALAIMRAAEVILYADTWISHFYRRGGIPPTAIALKGNISGVNKENEEKSWNDWLLGLGRRWWARVTRVYNADNLDVKQFGSSVTDLKNNEVYRQAIENIAMGTGMPLSLLLANSANYATAKEEKATWYENDIIPFCNWLAYGYNEQVFAPLGLYLEFHPETLDPNQEDETERATAFSVYGDAFVKYPTYGLWRGMANTLGLEISDDLDKAAQEYYTEKKQEAERMRQQTKPVEVAPSQEQPIDEQPAQEEQQPVGKWVPNLDQLEQLKTWRAKVFKHHKRGESFIFEWTSDILPQELRTGILAKLAAAKNAEDIEAAFDFAQFGAETVTPKPEYKSEIVTLADALNRYADAYFKQVQVST